MVGGTQRDSGQGKYEYNVPNEWWSQLPPHERERLKQEVTENLQEEVAFDRLVKTIVDAKLEAIWEDGPPEEAIQRLFEQADDEAIAKRISEEVVESTVEQHMAASSTTSETAKKAQKETLISIFRAVAIVGVAFGAVLTASFAIAGGYPLALVTLVMAGFCLYAYRYEFEE